MKRTTALLALLLALLLLAACGKHEHEWVDATCTEPETCATCGETRGEALGHRWKGGSCTEPETCARCGATGGEAPGHDWQPATCEKPETCARCGETRGEALGHDAAPADYWTASVCSRCGEELAPKLTSDFVAYGLDKNIVSLNETRAFTTQCYENEAYNTVGKVTFTRHETTPGDGDKLEERDGYVWHIVAMEILFDDENAYQYGMIPGICTEGYYDVREHDDSSYYDDDNIDHFTATFRGVAYECRFFRESGYRGWSGHSNTFDCTFYAQLPVDYDGFVVGVRNYGVAWPDGAYCYDLDNTDTVYFRMS